MKKIALAALAVLALAACSSTGGGDKTDDGVKPGSPGYVPGAYCANTHYNGAEYYIHFLPTPTDSGDVGLCGSAQRTLTQQQFRDLNLTMQCQLSDEKTMRQKHGIVAYYSDPSPKSVKAAKAMCA